MKVTKKGEKTVIDIERGDMHKTSRVHDAGKGDSRRPTDKEKFDSEHVRIFGK